MRKSVSAMLLVAAMLLMAALTGCGEDKKPAEAPKAEQKPAAAAPAPAAPAKEMQVGFVYVSPVGDVGWSWAHDQARKAIAEMPGVTTSFVESVPEGADAERVIQNMARKGFDIIFTTSFGYMDPTLKVAEQFPNITFMHCSGYKTAPNMSNYFGRMYQARYLTGMVAGAMTKSNILGYVAAFPIPEVIRGINAYTMGARAMNPKAEVRVVWTKTWYDPATEKEAAKSLLDVGADVIAQHQDSPGPQEAAQERGLDAQMRELQHGCAEVGPLSCIGERRAGAGEPEAGAERVERDAQGRAYRAPAARRRGGLGEERGDGLGAGCAGK